MIDLCLTVNQKARPSAQELLDMPPFNITTDDEGDRDSAKPADDQ